jgi:tRNA 2-selenouridine synthase
VSIEKLHIEEFLKRSKDALVIDVRSPGEYHHAHIPGAINVPLFTDEERKVVGTAYKQVSRKEAIKIGLDYFGPKMKGIVEQVEELIGNKQNAISKGDNCQLPLDNCLFIHCWRGGMRSGAIAWLLNLYGFKVNTLAGGYKAYRNYVFQTFEQPFPLKILGGFTGSGKTELLKQLEKEGEVIIDLETIASHKGSAFGNINMPEQPSQEMFENILAEELWKKSLPIDQQDSPLTTHNSLIWLEDESQRIGHVNIPAAFWKTMRNSPVFFLEVPFEQRLDHITEEYCHFDKERLLNAIERISKRLGGLNTNLAKEALEQDNFKECFCILLKYYDKHYLKGLHNRENLPALLQIIKTESVSVENTNLLLTKHQTV